MYILSANNTLYACILITLYGEVLIYCCISGPYTMPEIYIACLDNPQGEIIQNQFSMPLPRISNREVVAMKIWIPETLTTDNKSGLFIHVCVQVVASYSCVYV